MAQPKILANLDQLKSLQFADGISYLGVLNNNETLLDKVTASGIYLFVVENNKSLPLTFLTNIQDDSNYANKNFVYTLQVIKTEDYLATNDFFVELGVDFPTNTIQIIERLGTTLTNNASRDIWYREYINNSGSWVWSDWCEGGGGGKVECDSALSTTSTNPVQNKIVATALAGKSDTNHTHSTYATTTALNNKLDKSGGTMTGALTAQANTNYTTYQVRNIAFSTSASTPTGNGSILGVYS